MASVSVQGLTAITAKRLGVSEGQSADGAQAQQLLTPSLG
jgi:hypothetical protein